MSDIDHVPANRIDSTVTRLLVYTKELLSCLDKWANNKASEEEVSDVYVKLGNEFNLACRSFIAAGIETHDLGDVPAMLRQVLERTLSEEASKQALDKYLPHIREIIVVLLRQLKHKQNLARQRSGSATQIAHHNHSRSISAASGASIGSGPAMAVKSASSGSATHTRRNSAGLPHQGISTPQKPPQGPGPATQPPAHPQIRPPPPPGGLHTPGTTPGPGIGSPAPDINTGSPVRLNQPPVSPSGALTALQQSHALERRASRRFSQYHMTKIMNGAPENALPTSAPHSTVPADYTETGSVIEDRDPPRSARKVKTSTLTSVPESTLSDLSGSSPTSPTPGPSKVTMPVAQSFAVFFRMGGKIRKGTLTPPPSLAAIRLQFVDLFGYTPLTGEVFPDLTIQDHDTGVEYELTQATLQDVKFGSLITLCAKTEQELSMSEQIKNLAAVVTDLSTKVDTRLGAVPPKGSRGNPLGTPQIPGTPQLGRNPQQPRRGSGDSVTNPQRVASPVQRLPSDSTEYFRQELAVMRQICNKAVNSARQEIKVIQARLAELQASNQGSNRGFMSASHQKLGEETQQLVTWLEDLQDLVESQRKDVASRGVRLSQKQLDGVNRQLHKATQDLNNLQNFIKREKPTWSKTWEAELNTIVEEQHFFKLQEQLVNDLGLDLKSAKETFDLVEQCSLELSKTDVKRNPVAAIPPAHSDQLFKVADAVLGEVSALKPNHAQRVEAIERAERLRKRELEIRNNDEFKQELGDFVEENKLKQSGGVEEAERRRKERDEMMINEQRRTDIEMQKQKEQAKEERRLARQKQKEHEKTQQADFSNDDTEGNLQESGPTSPQEPSQGSHDFSGE